MSQNTIQFKKPDIQFNPKWLLGAVIAVIGLTGAFTCFYTVNPESVAVVQRFGKYISTEDPGLHFKLPYGIDHATVVPIRRQLKLEFGFSTPGAVTNPDQSGDEPERERDMVTGDLNAAQVEWILQYTITDPKNYLFQLRNPGPTLRDICESVVCEVIGDRTVDEVLTFGRNEIEVESLSKLSAILAPLQIGVTAELIQLKNVNPPSPVKRSFDEVNNAKQEREQMINEANREYNRVIPRAEGQAEQRVSTAEGYAERRINEAEGDVARFRELLTQYEKAPQVTKQRLYLETMATILPKVGRKVILDEDAKQFLPLLNVEK